MAALTWANAKARSWSIWARWERVVPHHLQPDTQAADTRVSPKSKAHQGDRKPKATWVESSFTAEVEYRNITSEGLLRQSSFMDLFRNQE